MIDAFPLTWPSDQLRTPAHLRQRGRFEVTFGRARDELLESLRKLGAVEVVISSNLELKRDGMPYASAREPADPGVAVYFRRGKRQLVIACDSYTSTRANIRAVGATVEALRAIERHGATALLERAFTGFAALPPAGGTQRPWREVLGVGPAATFDQARATYRELARRNHPDAGGNADEMARINRAWDEAQKELGS